MAELGWRPREVLGTLVDVYLNLSVCEPFAKAVASDERSYKRYRPPSWPSSTFSLTALLCPRRRQFHLISQTQGSPDPRDSFEIKQYNRDKMAAIFFLVRRERRTRGEIN